MIEQQIVFDFLKKAYFGSTTGGVDEYDLASNRAYRDFCRTINFLNKPKSGSSKLEQESFAQMKFELRNSVTSLFRGIIPAKNAAEFDKWHEDTCEAIIRIYKDKVEFFSYGQAQKWVNMFMKYLCVLSPEKVNSLFEYLHVPFDNIVLAMAAEMGAFVRPTKRWSNWTKEDYLCYRQKLKVAIEKRYPGLSPIVWEFKNWKGEIPEN